MIYASKADIRIHADGQVLHFDSEAKAYGYIAVLGTRLKDTHRAGAEARCALGWALRQLHESLPGYSFKAIAKRCNINARTAAYCVEFAKVVADEQTGRLNSARWEQAQELTREYGRQHGIKMGTDSITGEYSLNAVMIALGIKSPSLKPDRKIPGTGGNGTGVPNTPEQGMPGTPVPNTPQQGDDAEPYDPLQAALDQLTPVPPRRPRPEFLPASEVTAAARAAGCVGASQPDLPWHLAESARTLAQRAAELEAAVQRGEVDSDFAHGIQARIDELLTDLAAANAGAA